MTGKRSLGWIAGILLVLVWSDAALAQYHAGVGRFLQRDPVGHADGMNLYQFVGGRPVIALDPSGEAMKYFDVSTTITYKKEELVSSSSLAFLQESSWSKTEKVTTETWSMTHGGSFNTDTIGNAVNGTVMQWVPTMSGEEWTTTSSGSSSRPDRTDAPVLVDTYTEKSRRGAWTSLEMSTAVDNDGRCGEESQRHGILVTVTATARDYNKRGVLSYTGGLDILTPKGGKTPFSFSVTYQPPNNRTQAVGLLASYSKSWLICCCVDNDPDKCEASERPSLPHTMESTTDRFGRLKGFTEVKVPGLRVY